jgi:hypothetical protein
MQLVAARKPGVSLHVFIAIKLLGANRATYHNVIAAIVIECPKQCGQHPESTWRVTSKMFYFG